jgi:4-hydroxythreonine-4-phosphate dehydrogenase
MKPRIAITVGDPAGIGPEITAKAVRDKRVLAACDPIVVADPVAFALHKEALPECEILSCPGIDRKIPIGEPSKASGTSAVAALTAAVGLVKSRQAHALVTAPVSKESFALAEVKTPGHTEWLAEQAGTPCVGMLMVSGALATLLLTRHIPLSKVSEKLTSAVFQDGARLAYEFARDVLRIKKPRVVACGLNPHAGDNGILGSEEDDVLRPAITALKKRHIPILGPVSADVAFADMSQGRYDIALACYHDQGMIPLKLFGRHQMVNVTLGLPYIRTSPAHGTAYDIAGQDKADPEPMIEAIRLAALYTDTAKLREPKTPIPPRRLNT